ncbi:MAG: hypothetical protein AAB473_02230 [Patescibacteria group bacterium]
MRSSFFNLLLLIGPIVTSGCFGGGGPNKYTDVEPCDGANIINGTWMTETPVGVVYDGNAYGDSITGCQSTEYDFAIAIGGNRNPTGSGETVWGGLVQTGTVQSRDWVHDGGWNTSSADDFAGFTDTDDTLHAGYVQVTCYAESDGRHFACGTHNDYIVDQHNFEFTVDEADPNKATINLYSAGRVFMGDISGTAESDFDCKGANAEADEITMVRVEPTSTFDDQFWLADDENVECTSEAEASESEADKHYKHNNHTVLWWAQFVYNWWDAHKAETNQQQKAAAVTVINQNVEQAYRTVALNFVYDVLNNYHNGGNCYLTITEECTVRALIDRTYLTIHNGNFTFGTLTGPQRRTVDSAAWDFGLMFVAWDEAHNQ